MYERNCNLVAEGGLTLEFVYTKTPHNTMDIRAEIK